MQKGEKSVDSHAYDTGGNGKCGDLAACTALLGDGHLELQRRLLRKHGLDDGLRHGCPLTLGWLRHRGLRPPLRRDWGRLKLAGQKFAAGYQGAAPLGRPACGLLSERSLINGKIIRCSFKDIAPLSH
jgi:hypothetical protein